MCIRASTRTCVYVFRATSKMINAEQREHAIKTDLISPIRDATLVERRPVTKVAPAPSRRKISIRLIGRRPKREAPANPPLFGRSSPLDAGT